MLLQFMESYKSVKLAAVADSFGVSADFMDRELSEFIVAGRLPAKIDKVAGVVETNRCGILTRRPPFAIAPLVKCLAFVHSALHRHLSVLDALCGGPCLVPLEYCMRQ